jgi:acetyltransferase-like isoleucine patch superfamily enzyme/glycosyltransferase involved in cell wall biosynthesis
MENNEIVLSICIPTYNRAALLQNTLHSITSQAAFAESNAIEIVISDNFSEDDTPAAVAPFLAAFPGRIVYHRHPETMSPDLNFEFVMKQGKGTYLKLHNDNLMVNNGALAEILKVLRATVAEKPIIFFTNGNNHQGNQIEVLTTLNDFVRRVSYFSTWIGGFGMWREEFLAMPDFARHEKLRLVQTDVVLRLMATGKRAIVLYDRYFAGQPVGRKTYKVGGYNIAEVFGKNYLTLLKMHLAPGLLDDAVFQQEKKTILLNHIIPYYFDQSNGFQKTGFFPYMQDYLHDDYFYQAIEKLITDVPPRPQAAPVAAPRELSADEKRREYWVQMREHWRTLNPHNETGLDQIYGPFDFNKVKVGRMTYGPLIVWTFGNGEESLSIGSFSSIAAGVTFILGGNHPHKGFSTFPFLVKYFNVGIESKTKGPVVIGDDVWIGTNAIILSGVTIGRGAVIGAGAVVSQDIPPYSIVAGNPAQVMRYRFEPAVIEKLCKLDYARLSDAAIVRNRDILYEAITADNVDDIIARLSAPE